MDEVAVEIEAVHEEGSRKESQKPPEKPDAIVFGSTDLGMILREFEHYASKAQTQKSSNLEQEPLNPEACQPADRTSDNEQAWTYFSEVINWSRINAEYLAHKLVAVATFWSDDYPQLNYDINREPERFHIGKLRKLADESYSMHVMDNRTEREYEVRIPSKVAQASWARELVKEADEEYRKTIDEQHARTVHFAPARQEIRIKLPRSMEEILIGPINSFFAGQNAQEQTIPRKKDYSLRNIEFSLRNIELSKLLKDYLIENKKLEYKNKIYLQ